MEAEYMYRVKQLEVSVEKKADKEELERFAEEVRGLRRTLIQFIVTIAGSAVLLSFTVLQILATRH